MSFVLEAAPIQDSYNRVLMDNLARIVVLHSRIPGQFHIDPLAVPADYFADWPSTGINGVIVDRSSDNITQHFNKTPEEIVAEAGGGLVVDYGCGSSDYLSRIKSLGAETLSVDKSRDMIDYQKTKGVPGLVTDGVRIDVPDDSVSVLNASYSLPYWAVNLDQVSQFFDEVTRVLVKPGGVAYIGSIVHMFLHKHWESAVSCDLAMPKSYHGLWSVDKPHFATTSLIESTFIDTLLSSARSGDSKLQLYRRWKHGGITDIRANQPQVHVPNFVRIELL